MLTKFLASLTLVALALVFVGTATADHNPNIATMVTNFGQASDNSLGLESGIYWAQAFTTGSHGAGYTLTSVRVKSEDTDNDVFAVSLCETSQGVPTAYCSTLTPPGSFAAGTLVFTAPRDLDLAKNTT